MFSGKCTVFNYFAEEAVWYPHIITDVHIETNKAAVLKQTGDSGNDKVVLHIPYTDDDGERYVKESNGNKLLWLPPKSWKASSSAGLSITFNPDCDFFMIGEWDGNSPVQDADYTDRRDEGFYAYMNREKDGVFKMTQVQMYNLIPHFEITGA